MPINLPNLDDRTYADLMEEALALLPAHAPEWTNHNPSDPGITLLEMFACLAEMLIYRLNRVTDANKLAFVKLLNPQYDSSLTVNQAIQATVLRLRDEQRAVTVGDFERLAVAADSVNIARAYCLPRRNLESGQSGAARLEVPGHVSVVLVPVPNSTLDVSKIKTDLESRCLITTQLHVVAPVYLNLKVQLTLVPNSDAQTQDAVATILKTAIKTLTDYFDPLTGAAQGTGWPLGRNVYKSEIYALLDKLPGVDYVEPTMGVGNSPLDELDCADKLRRLVSADGQQFIGIQIEPNELVKIDVNEIDLQVNKTITKPQ